MSYLSRPKHIWKAPKNFQRHSEGIAMLSSSLVSCLIKLEILRQKSCIILYVDLSFLAWTFMVSSFKNFCIFCVFFRFIILVILYFLQNMSFKTLIAQISLPGRNQSAGTVYELDKFAIHRAETRTESVRFGRCIILRSDLWEKGQSKLRIILIRQYSCKHWSNNQEKVLYCNKPSSTVVLFYKIFCPLIFHFLLILRFLFLFNSLPTLR